MAKTPKNKFSLETSKTPKIEESPAANKGIPISWQLSQIDEDSKWGLALFKNHFKFSFTELLIEQLSDIHNDLYHSLTELDGNKFNSLEEFMNRLHTLCNGNLSITDQKIIISSIQEYIFWTEIYPKLKYLEQKTWYELETEMYSSSTGYHTKHHSVKISKIIPEARRRLEKLNLDDLDELFSIRLSGRYRVWGIRQYSFLRILWFDTEHEICPS